MQLFELNAEKRDTSGKGASRRLRRAGKVPAILYGAGQEAVALQLSESELVKHLENEAFYASILKLAMDGTTQQVVLKDLQRHPYKRQLTHLDLQRIDETKTLSMRVPIHFLNEEKCPGVKDQGGVISHLMNEIEISCLPKDLPEFIAIDLVDLNVGDTIHLGDIEPPAGVELTGGDPARPLVSVHMPKAVVEEEEVEGEVEEGEVVAEEGEAEAAPDAD